MNDLLQNYAQQANANNFPRVSYLHKCPMGLEICWYEEYLHRYRTIWANVTLFADMTKTFSSFSKKFSFHHWWLLTKSFAFVYYSRFESGSLNSIRIPYISNCIHKSPSVHKLISQTSTYVHVLLLFTWFVLL